jgi:hydrogenase 3 maturation protease
VDWTTLTEIVDTRTVVLTVGNELRGDDAAGPFVAKGLVERHSGRVFDGGQAPENFLGPLRRSGAELVLVVDAADFGGNPGDVRLLAGDELDGACVATHGAPLGMLMQALEEELGVQTLLLAVQAGATALGEPMSHAVREASERIIEELDRALGAHGARRPGEV